MFELQSPNSQITVRPGNIVKLNRFDDECWVVNLGWFSYAGNRPINGWYLVSTSRKDKVKPLNLSDLDDIYVVEIGEVKEDYKELDPKIKKLIHDLKVQVEDLQTQVAQLTVEIEAKDKVIEEKGQEILILQKQINDLAAEITALESQHNLDVETIETLNSQVRAQAEIIAEKAAEIRRLTTRVEELAAENEVLSQQHQEDLATIQQQASTIQEQAQSIATLTAENETLTDENDRLTDENAELVTQHEADVETISEQATAIEAKDGQISELNDEVSTLEGTVAEQQATITRQNTTIDELNERRIPVYIEPQLVPKEVTPQLTNQYIEPPEGKNGFNAISVNPITSDLVPNCESQNIAKGKTILGVAGTFDSFPENPVGGIYFYEPDENDNPTKCKIYNFNFTPPIEFPDWFFRNNKMPHIKEVVFDSSNFYGIAPYAFFNSPTISKVVLSNSIISIGASAFLSAGLSSINIPNSLVSIDSHCFEQCHALTGKFVFSSNLQQIGSNAFYETEIQEVAIPSANIGSLAFFSCRALYKVFLGNAINGIHNRAFEGCTNLIDVTIEGGFNANGLNLSASTLYSQETIVSWLEALADRTGQTAYTLKMGTTNLNKLTAEQRAIATNKNWNLN